MIRFDEVASLAEFCEFIGAKSAAVHLRVALQHLWQNQSRSRQFELAGAALAGWCDETPYALDIEPEPYGEILAAKTRVFQLSLESDVEAA